MAETDIPLPPDSGSTDDETDPLADLPAKQGEERDIGTTFDSSDWRMKIQTQLAADLRAFAEKAGYPAFTLDSWLRDQMDSLMRWVEPFVLTQDALNEIRASIPEGSAGGPATAVTAPFYEGLANPHVPEGLTHIYGLLRDKIAIQFPGFSGDTGGGAGGGGGGGSRLPTSSEIRQMYDMDQLTDQAQKLARAYLVEDHPDPRGIAKAYVDAVVSSKGQQKIDFTTFVKGRLERTPRWQQIQRGNKTGIDPLEYVSRYAQQALQTLGGNRGQGIGDVAAEGAALGGAPGTFQKRLEREDAVRNQSTFISGLEKRISGIANVLRG